MFSGIIEEVGEVVGLESQGSNLRMAVSSKLGPELKIDQSLSHNGVCLTVTEIDGNIHYVDAIAETLDKSNLGDLCEGNVVNLERSIRMNDRLDGHIVQGHVDQTAVLKSITDLDGSWTFCFRFEENPHHVLIDKGSIGVNGVSLTISALRENEFEVSIIPYTFEHTNFGQLKEGDRVNIEFDVIGKYVERLQRPQ